MPPSLALPTRGREIKVRMMMIKKTNTSGQTALILILLTAAALIFLAITLNWGRIAQTKALITIAADQSASQLASDAASYGEFEKQTNLKDTNQIIQYTSVLLALILLIVAIIVAFISWGTSFFLLALLAAGMAATNLALQVVVIQPGITRLWNALQQSQPVQQQFYEGGIATALENSVGDQVNITDYLDWNANGRFGLGQNNFPNDTVSRFAVYYTDRLKMLNQPPLPQMVCFYNALNEFMNGETCDENANDVSLCGASPNPACAGLNCANNPIDPACQMKIPNGFQLNDACAGSSPGNTATYSPYCDPCCQPVYVPGSSPPKALRPSNCPQPPASNDCAANPNDPVCVPSQCATNNPYGTSYPFLYDQSFQNNYTAGGISFMDQFGRDQQMGPFSASLTPQGNPNNGIYFPNGIYPFFWLMKDYSPEVDNINPTSGLLPSQLHWCVAPGYTDTAGQGFLDLTQLGQSPYTLPYPCSGLDCCVDNLLDNITGPSSSGNIKIDIVGSGPNSNPALDTSFGDGASSPNVWLEGDNQMCLPSWPYNGSPSMDLSNGRCEWRSDGNAPPPPLNPTTDNPDDTMHTLSDFVSFADTLLSEGVGTLSSTFTTWYSQAAAWIDPSTGRLPPLVSNLNAWDTVIKNWLNNTTYASSGAWCVPQTTTGFANEDNAITSNGAVWGSLPSVINCLNYNASTAPNNYQACQSALASGTCSIYYSANPPPACAASILGRTLLSSSVEPMPPYDGCTGNYAKWVSDSYTLFNDEAQKFALRSAFLTDVFARGQTMHNIFPQASAALQSFLSVAQNQLNQIKPCGDGSTCTSLDQCRDGTPCVPSPTSALPNSVIYGWVDNKPNGQSGSAHIVKVTAYSPGRGGSFASGMLPWIRTKCENTFLGLCIERSYTLVDRDGPVYVSVKRWDEDHSNSIFFPNGRPLWKFMFHNPNGGSAGTGQGLPPSCIGINGAIGFGLEPLTVAGLNYVNYSSSTQDVTALGNAFMLNDRGDGKVDPYAKGSGAYSSCLSQADALLANAPESHMCAEYMASRIASECHGGGVDCTGMGDTDYSLKFYDCGRPLPPEDL